MREIQTPNGPSFQTGRGIIRERGTNIRSGKTDGASRPRRLASVALASAAFIVIAVSAMAGPSTQASADLNAALHVEDLKYAGQLLAIRRKRINAQRDYQNEIDDCNGVYEGCANNPTSNPEKGKCGVNRIACEGKANNILNNASTELQKERNDADAEHAKAVEKIQFDFKWNISSGGAGGKNASTPQPTPMRTQG
jgi:hypothetical protein